MCLCIPIWLAATFTALPAPPPQEAGTQLASPASQPASQPANASATLRKPEQARILEQLIRDAERPRPIIPDSSTDVRPADSERDRGLLLEGTILVERQGRLIRSDERSLFEMRLESDGANRTLEILPNAWLEAMEREAATGASEFIITAEVTRYRGENYLIVRKVRRVRTHGNLSP